jgi:predicted RecA/RadA family phage recombinase
MAKNHIEEGKSMPWTNSTGSAVAAGTTLLVGSILCVALGNIAVGAEGQLATEEVWEVAKEAPLVIAQGDQLYWDAANSVATKTDTDVPCGKAFAETLSASTTVLIKLNV